MRHLLKNINLTKNRQNLAGEGDGGESIVENTVDDLSRQLDSDQRESIRSDHSV
jgi:hypothetical protein